MPDTTCIAESEGNGPDTGQTYILKQFQVLGNCLEGSVCLVQCLLSVVFIATILDSDSGDSQLEAKGSLAA